MEMPLPRRTKYICNVKIELREFRISEKQKENTWNHIYIQLSLINKVSCSILYGESAGHARAVCRRRAPGGVDTIDALIIVDGSRDRLQVEPRHSAITLVVLPDYRPSRRSYLCSLLCNGHARGHRVKRKDGRCGVAEKMVAQQEQVGWRQRRWELRPWEVEVEDSIDSGDEQVLW